MTSYSDLGLNASTGYSYTVKAYDASANLSASSNTASATTSAVQQISLTSQDIGSPSIAGSSSYSNGTYTVTAIGGVVGWLDLTDPNYRQHFE